MRTGGVEPPQRGAQGYSLRSSPVLSVRVQEGRPAGFEPVPRGSRPRMLPLHHGHHEAGTTGLEPAASRLTSECSIRLSYAPMRCSSAGGIRTHGLELMRLARTASPLPRVRGLAGRNRTCGLRRPKSAGWPAPLQPDDRCEHPRRELNPRFRVENPASSPFDHGGSVCPAPAAGIEPAISRVTTARLANSTTPEG